MGRAGRASRDAAAGGDIEFVAPRHDLFGTATGLHDDGPAAPGGEAFTELDDDRPARWTTALAGLGVASLIAVGVVAAAPWDDETAAPATTVPATSAPPTTSGADTATTESGGGATAAGEDPFVAAAAGGPPVGYLLDPAILDDGTLTAVNRPAATAESSTHLSWLDVWATPGASSLLGDWVAIEVSPWPTSSMSASSAERVAVGDRVGLLELTGVLPQLLVPIDDRTVVLSASGWTTEELRALAGGIELANGRPVYPGGGVAGHDLVVSRVSAGWGAASELRSEAESSVSWIDGEGAWVDVSTRPADDAADLALRQLLTLPIEGDPYSGPASRVVVGGRVVTVGHQIDDVSTVQATFDERGRTVTVTRSSGQDDVDALLAYVDPAVLRPGTADEWRDLDLLLGQDTTGSVDAGQEELVTSGSLPDGTPWTLSLMPAPLGGDVTYEIGLVDTAEGQPTWAYLAVGPVPSVTVSTGGALAVVVVAESTGAVGLRAGPPGGGVQTTGLLPVPDGTSDRTRLLFGILRFDVLGPWTVEVVDVDGNVLGETSSDGASAVQ